MKIKYDKETDAEMHISERTVDAYRETMFQKFNVRSRVGLCLEVVRRQVVPLQLFFLFFVEAEIA
ncbi:MAG: LuxR C-terminal-related transcriptional regulator [Chitinophagaceae bacterium]